MEQLTVPRNVHEAVRQRLPRLSNRARNLLSLVAVAGRRFDLWILCELTSQDETTVLDGLKELVAAQLVIEAAPATFASRHPLTRDAVYSDLLPGERQALHRHLVETLEQTRA